MVIITNILTKAGAINIGIELVLEIKNGSTMQLVIRRHIHNKDMFYLNLSGNLLTFFEGCNVYGWPEADKQVLKAFKYCITYAQDKAETKFSLRVRKAIVNLEFNINSLEFACYTGKVADNECLGLHVPC